MVASNSPVAQEGEKSAIVELVEDAKIVAKEIPSLSESIKDVQAKIKFNYDVFQSWMHRGDGIPPDERDEFSVDDLMLDMRYVSKDSENESYSASVHAKYMANFGGSASVASIQSELSKMETSSRNTTNLDIEDVKDVIAYKMATDALKNGTDTDASKTLDVSDSDDDEVEEGEKDEDIRGDSESDTKTSSFSSTLQSTVSTTAGISPGPEKGSSEERSTENTVNESVQAFDEGTNNRDATNAEEWSAQADGVREQPTQESVIDELPQFSLITRRADDDDKTVSTTSSKLSSVFKRGKGSLLGKKSDRKSVV